MLAASLGRHRCHRALDDLQQGLLNPFAADIPGNGDVFAFTADFVDFVDVDDAPLGGRNILSRGLVELQKNVFNVLADISRLGKGCASAMAKGTLSFFARVRASRVLPVPVGPSRRTLDFSISTSSSI
jgi:hypothetical protein